jgi:HAD superfamily hydrolase (TIGR01549 family)
LVKLTTIFFDVGGTLIHPDMDSLMAPLLERTRPGDRELAHASFVAKRALRCSANRAEPSTSEGLDSHAGPVNRGHWYIFFKELLDQLGESEDLLPELVARAGVSDYWRLVDPEASATLAHLRTKYRLGIISNADGHIARVLERGGLARFFDVVIDSRLAGYEKPDPRIFRAALEQIGTGAEQSLYVGDIYEIDYAGAREAGMHAVLVDPHSVYADWNVARISSLAELPRWIDQQRIERNG